MTQYTVIAQASDSTGTLSVLAVIPGECSVVGEWRLPERRFVRTVTAGSPDQAAGILADAARLLGGAPNQQTADDAPAWQVEAAGGKWTVIGLADSYYLRLFAATPGEVEVHGRWGAILDNRWVGVVEAATADDAYDAAYAAWIAEHGGEW
ncbi:hypothetical protein ABZ671_18875 [Micromonospora sp. NPDC006766]|uniref:hypothetical protein n=1 Tax=Micromonospora sp. NPDC006766 TaxID=3154778 RepID=UPI0033FB5784